jgi:cystathionine gamma-synthase
MGQSADNISNRALALEPLALYGGQASDPGAGSVVPPMRANSTPVQSSPVAHQGLSYSRAQNPTRFNFEHRIAQLEVGSSEFTFASGMVTSCRG